VTKTVDETPTEKVKTVEKHDVKTETQQKQINDAGAGFRFEE
jgi:hypothetical protein